MCRASGYDALTDSNVCVRECWFSVASERVNQLV
jgi:hypothetical protein